MLLFARIKHISHNRFLCVITKLLMTSISLNFITVYLLTIINFPIGFFYMIVWGFASCFEVLYVVALLHTNIYGRVDKK